jgi:hypothetical protein
MKSLIQYLPENYLLELADAPVDSMSPVNGSINNTNPALTDHSDKEFAVDMPVLYKGHKGTIKSIDGKIVTVSFKNGTITKKVKKSDVKLDEYVDEPDPEESYKRSLANLKKMAGY